MVGEFWIATKVVGSVSDALEGALAITLPIVCDWDEADEDVPATSNAPMILALFPPFLLTTVSTPRTFNFSKRAMRVPYLVFIVSLTQKYKVFPRGIIVCM